MRCWREWSRSSSTEQKPACCNGGVNIIAMRPERRRSPFFSDTRLVFYELIHIFTTAVIFLLGTGMAASGYIAFSSAYGAYTAAGTGTAVIIQMIASFRSSYSLISDLCLRRRKKSTDPGKRYRRRSEEKSPYRICISAIRRIRRNVLNGLSVHIREGESVGGSLGTYRGAENRRRPRLASRI